MADLDNQVGIDDLYDLYDLSDDLHDMSVSQRVGVVLEGL